MTSSMASPLFRQEAIESVRQRLTGTVIAAVPPRSRHYTMFALAIILLALLLLTLGSYPRRVQVRGLVAWSAGIARIASPSDARIEALHIAEGQRVRRGQPLVTVSLTQGLVAGREGIAAQLAELDRQTIELQRQRSLSSGLTSTDRDALLTQRDSARAAIGSLTRQQTILAQQIRLSQNQLQRANRLAKQGAGTRQEIEESERAMLSGKLGVETLAEKIIAQREQLAMLDSRIAGRAIIGFQSDSQISERIAGIARERAVLLRQDRLVLVAAMDGFVGDIALRPGEAVAGQRTILSVIPSNSALEVQLYAPSSAVGFVRPGQPVKLHYDAFPFQKFGTGSGQVTWVASVPTDVTELPRTPEGSEPLFRIRVAIDPAAPRQGPNPGSLRTGMTLSANLILENRNLWEVFLGPVFRALQS